MHTKPVFLNLLKISFPITAIISILHRVSGVLVFLLIPLFLCMLQASLGSESSFDSLKTCLTHPVFKFILWAGVSALLYHLVAGIRHMIMDLGFGESVRAGRISSYIVFITFTFLMFYWSCYIW